MIDKEKELVKKIAETISRSQGNLLKGFAQTTGINKIITVKLDNGETVKAKSLDVTYPGTVNLVRDDKNNSYVCWLQKPSNVLTSSVLRHRKVKAKPEKEIIKVSIIFTIND